MSQKQKLSIEEKIRITQAFNQGIISISEATRMSGCSRKTVKEWVRNYEVDGINAFLPKQNRAYPPEVKLHAVEDYLSGNESSADVCKKYHIRSCK